MMIRVGLTGNIGTGKTMVSRIFETLGTPVYHADEEAKKFLTDKVVKDTLLNRFGDLIKTDNQIDRKKLATIVFKDKNSLEFLNSVIHPRVKADLKSWMSAHLSDPYIIQEAAILFESGFHTEFDKVILVVSPPEIAVKRVMERDGLPEQEIRKRIHHQWDQERKKELADFVIYNDETHLVIPQVLTIHNILRG